MGCPTDLSLSVLGSGAMRHVSPIETGSSKLDLCTTFVSAYVLVVRSRVLWLIRVLLVRSGVTSTGAASRIYKIMQIKGHMNKHRCKFVTVILFP